MLGVSGVLGREGEREMTTHSEQNKELFEFIDLRIGQLKEQKKDNKLKKYPAKRREIIRRQILGRIFELRWLKSIIAQGQVFEQINNMRGRT